MNRSEDCVLVGFSQQTDRDHAVLIVGRDTKSGINIFNAFQGEEVIELYERLITKKGNENG